MREIGVRELKTTLSQTLRAVARGQQVRVTLRGQPLADIVPAGSPRAAGGARARATETGTPTRKEQSQRVWSGLGRAGR
jgi:prevent-host-death family protein